MPKAKARTIWTTFKTSAFWIKDGEPIYLNAVEIPFVVIDQQMAKLVGTLPDAIMLDQFHNGETIEIVNKECGPRHRYYSDEVIIRLTTCRIMSKGLSPIISLQDEDRIRLTLELSCDVEIVRELEE